MAFGTGATIADPGLLAKKKPIGGVGFHSRAPDSNAEMSAPAAGLARFVIKFDSGTGNRWTIRSDAISLGSLQSGGGGIRLHRTSHRFTSHATTSSAKKKHSPWNAKTESVRARERERERVPD